VWVMPNSCLRRKYASAHRCPLLLSPLDLPRTLKDSRSIGVIMSLQIHTAIIHGIIWSALWATMVAVSVHRFPWTIAHDYPADVTECAHILQPSVNQKRLAIVFFCLRFFAACRYGDLFGFLYLRRKRRFFCHNFLPFVDYGDDVERRRFTRRGLVHDLHAFGKTVHLSGNRKLQR